MDSTVTQPDAVDATELTDAPPTSEVLPENTSTEKDWAAEYAALHDQHLRLAADFENFRKRVQTEREGLLKYGAQQSIEMLIPVLDNLELGSNSLSEESSPKMLYQSFTMLQQQLVQALQDAGLKQDSPVGDGFDPAKHEAISQEPSDQPENTILRVQKSGYTLHDRVLRPAQVIVSAPASQPEPTDTTFTTEGDNPFSAE